MTMAGATLLVTDADAVRKDDVVCWMSEEVVVIVLDFAIVFVSVGDVVVVDGSNLIVGFGDRVFDVVDIIDAVDDIVALSVDKVEVVGIVDKSSSRPMNFTSPITTNLGPFDLPGTSSTLSL